MIMKKFIGRFFIGIGVFVVAMGFMTCVGGMSLMSDMNTKVKKDSLLFLKLEGVILDGDQFLKDLKKYRDNKFIKGVLIQVNSPGGVVGPSQEIYSEIKRVKEVLNKPVVVSGNGVVASGAYYAAVGASKIVTNPGTMMGSIGVIMNFANLERLYSWAKIQMYSLKTGPYKDSGADYRSMRSDEKKLFQSMIDEVHMQFKTAVAKGRNLPLDKVTLYSDGRIFTGETAVKLGFADQMGTLEDARILAGKLAGLGEDPKLFTPPKKRPDILGMLSEVRFSGITKSIKKQLKFELLGKPLYLAPGMF